MAEKTITSANAVFSLTVPGVYPVPVQLQGFSTDKSFGVDPIDFAEIQMGVDGFMAAGYTPMPVPMTVMLLANSPSRDIFNQIIRYMLQRREVIYLAGVIDLKSTGESFTLTRGILQNGSVIPSGGKILQPVEMRIVWERIQPSVL